MGEIRKKHGIVVLMDALGAKDFSDEKIQAFLAARKDLNEALHKQLELIKGSNDKYKETIKIKPTTYTFGDTLIIVAESNLDGLDAHFSITCLFALIQNYMFLSLKKGILLRGAFSFGEYFDDEDSNSVMGKAVADAASWYEKADWFGLASTPRASNLLNYLYSSRPDLGEDGLLIKYNVPMKDGRKHHLHCLAWPARFFFDYQKISKTQYLEIISKLDIPFGTEAKYLNAQDFFNFVVEDLIQKQESGQSVLVKSQ